MLGRLALNLLADRNRPPLERLESVPDAESFVWRVLPHAARTFGLCIAVLPSRMARPLAVAYLYCRILDTYEDLIPGSEARIEALRSFIDRFEEDGSRAHPTPPLDPSLARSDRERVYLLLVRRYRSVDEILFDLPRDQRLAILRLVRRMGEGMIRAVETFSRQGGALSSPEQLSRYCWSVLGNPILFAEEMQRLDRKLTPHPGEERVATCRAVGEAIQLANITRDLEADLTRGVYYHPRLVDAAAASGDRRARLVAEVRRELLVRALELAPAFRPFIEHMPAPAISLARGAGLALVLTTEAYYRRATMEAGLELWPENRRITRFAGAWIWLRCVLSRAAASRFLADQAIRFRNAHARAQPPLTPE